MKNTLLPLKHTLAANCVNMRPSPACDLTLEPVMAAAVVTEQPWHTIAIFNVGEGEVLELMARGNILGASRYATDEGPGDPYTVDINMEGEITGCYQGRDCYMVMTTRRIYRAVTDECGMLRVERPLDPEAFDLVSAEVVSETTMSVPVAPFQLSGNYNASATSLMATDASRLAGAMYDAYCSAVADATASGRLIAPVMMRYIVYDSSDRPLFVSVPKLIVPSGRHSTGMTTTMPLDREHRNAGGGTLPLPLYRVGITVTAPTDALVGIRASRLDIQLSMQLHEAEEYLSPLHQLDGDTLHATVPGCHSSTGENSRRTRLVLDALQRCDDIFTTVLSIGNPFSGDKPGTYTLDVPGSTVKRDKAALSAAKYFIPDTLCDACRLPNLVTAGTALRDGMMTVMGNVTISLWPGHPLAYYVNHGAVTDTVTTMTTVTFNDGRQLVRRDTRRGWRSCSLTPLIAYPSPMARSIEFVARDSDGNLYSRRLPLTPCGRFSCYLSPTLQPIALQPDPSRQWNDDSESYMPAIHHPGLVLIFNGDSPADNVRGCVTGNGTIHTIHHAGSPSSSAWESSRSRYNVLGVDGIFKLALNGGIPMTPVRLDDRQVEREDAAVNIYTANGVPRVAAIAGGDLVIIDRNKVRTVARGVKGSILAWCRNHGELLIIEPNDRRDSQSIALVMHADHNGWSTRELPAATCCFNSPGGARLTSEAQNTLYDLNREVGDRRRCIYRTDINLKPLHKVRDIPFLNEVTLDLTASLVDGTLTIDAHQGKQPWRVFSRLIIDGEVNRPVCHHTIMPQRLIIRASLDAMLSPDAQLNGIDYE